MSRFDVPLSGREITFGEDEIIVSKTDLKGIITYANRVFVRISQFTEEELLGAPHNLIRHPEMPKGVFQFLWDTIQTGHEVFAYVVNKSKQGDAYWVLAHVTPTFDSQGKIVGYHSNRRKPRREAIDQVRPVYAALLKEEQKHSRPRDACNASLAMITDFLASRKQSYEEFVFSL